MQLCHHRVGSTFLDRKSMAWNMPFANPRRLTKISMARKALRSAKICMDSPSIGIVKVMMPHLKA